MNYKNVYIESFGYELAPNVISSDDIEKRLEPVYEKLHFQKGQLEALTGICERRLWDKNFKMSHGAILAGKKAIETSCIDVEMVEALVYGGVCRDNLEPATACAVADSLKISSNALVYDISNACLGVLNGIIDVANAIELGQIKAGLVVSCESSREIMDLTIKRLLAEKDMECFKKTVATLTGGSGAVAVLLCDESISKNGHRIIGGIMKNSTEHHKLCRWGPDTGIPATGLHSMETDSIGVLNHGVELGIKTYNAFIKEMKWPEDKPDKIICHQVGSSHQKTILNSLKIPQEKDFTTYRYLGNIGTVSLPITAAIAEERQFLIQGDIVGFFGIGSGLNCIMLGIKW